MSTSHKNRPPRIVFAFAALALAALFYAGAYLYTSFASPTTHASGSTSSQGGQSSESASSQAQVSSSSHGTEQTKESSARSEAKKQSSSQREQANSQSAKKETEKDSQTQSAKKESEKQVAEKQKSKTPRSMRYKLQGSCAARVEKSPTFAELTQQIGTFEDKGYTVAFVVHDLQTGKELTYNADEELYPASSIKAPFTTAVYQELVDKGEVQLEDVEPVAQETIVESSDEAYRALHESYGEQAFITWLEDAGVGPGSYESYEEMVSWNYPHICAKQFSLMWQRIYAYLGGKTAAAKQLSGFLEKRTVSSLQQALDKNTRSVSKMGWFDTESEYNSKPATVEGGVVYAKEGPYVIALMTNAPALLDELVPLERAVCAAHAPMLQ